MEFSNIEKSGEQRYGRVPKVNRLSNVGHYTWRPRNILGLTGNFSRLL